MIYFAKGSTDGAITPMEARQALYSVFDALGPKKRVLALPPDFTRLNSYAGPLTKVAYDYFGERLTDVMPALGTHTPMTSEQIKRMFEGVP